jgi:hypothetical protein
MGSASNILNNPEVLREIKKVFGEETASNILVDISREEKKVEVQERLKEAKDEARKAEKSIEISTATMDVEDLPVWEHEGERVVTLAQIDAVHGRIPGTAKQNFANNRERFIEGKDYFVVNRDDFEQQKKSAGGKKHSLNDDFDVSRGLILITEWGYLMLVRTFKDDLSWEIQRELVEGYFRAKNHAQMPNYGDRRIEEMSESEWKRYESLLKIAAQSKQLTRKDVIALLAELDVYLDDTDEQVNPNSPHMDYIRTLKVEELEGSTKKSVYAGYVSWCTANAHRPLVHAQFGKEVMKIFNCDSSLVNRRNGNRETIYRNVSLREVK